MGLRGGDVREGRETDAREEGMIARDARPNAANASDTRVTQMQPQAGGSAVPVTKDPQPHSDVTAEEICQSR